MLFRSKSARRMYIALSLMALSICASIFTPVIARSEKTFRLPAHEVITTSNASRIVPLLVLNHVPPVPYPVSDSSYEPSVRFSPDQTFIAHQASDGTLWLVDLHNGVERAILRGTLLPVLNWQALVQVERGNFGQTLRLWNMAQLLPTPNPSQGTDECRIIVTAPSSYLFEKPDASSARFLNLGAGDSFRVLATDPIRHWVQVTSDFGPAWLAPQAREYTGNCDNLPFWLLPGTEQSAISYAENQQVILNADGSITVLTTPVLAAPPPTPGEPTTLLATPSLQPLPTSFNGKPIHQVTLPWVTLSVTTFNYITPSVALSDTVPKYGVDENDSVWSLANGEMLFTIHIPQSPTSTPDYFSGGSLRRWQFNPDQTLLAYDYGNGTVHLWNLARKLDVQTLVGARSPFFSPDGHFIVTLDQVANKLHVWHFNADTNQFDSIIAADSDGATFSADSKLLLTLALDNDVWKMSVYDLSTYKLKVAFSMEATQSPALSFSAGNTLLFPAGQEDYLNGLSIRDATSGQSIVVLKSMNHLVENADSTLFVNAQTGNPTFNNRIDRLTLWGVPVNVLPTMPPTLPPPGTPTQIPTP